MFTILQTDTFADWLRKLKDSRAQARIAARIVRLRNGNQGHVRWLNDGLGEMKIPEGKGYRVYFIKRGTTIFLLLCGGDKSSQRTDIKEAKRLAKETE